MGFFHCVPCQKTINWTPPAMLYLQKFAMPKFLKLDYLSSEFDCFFFHLIPCEKCRNSYSKHFSIFYPFRATRVQRSGEGNSILYNMKKFYF